MAELGNIQKRTIMTYIFAGVFTCGFLMMGVGFVSYAAGLNKADTIESIRLATHTMKLEVDEHIEEELNAMYAAAVLPEDRWLLADDVVFDRVVERLTTYFPFISVGVADLQGDALWADASGKTRGSVAGEAFFLAALEGEGIITENREDMVSGENVNYFAVPIYWEDEETVRGVLFTAASEDALRNIVDRSLYAGQGLAHIVDSKGDFILRSNSPLVVATGANVLDLKGAMDPDKKKEMLEDFSAGRAGVQEDDIYGNNRLAAYEPLAYNGWILFYAVPEHLVNAGMRNLTTGIGGIIIASSVVFVLLLALLYLMDKKGRRELETLAFVDPVTKRGNYQKFLSEAEQLLSDVDGGKFAVCYADIVGFKYVNDLFGRDVGDRLLRYWSDRLADMAQPGTVFARVSADSFVMLCRYQSRWDIELRMLSMGRRVALFPETSARGYRLDINSGIYLMNGDGETLPIEGMLDRAITAQKIVKEKGVGEHVGFYSTEMREKKLWEAEVTAAMEHALENEEFLFYLQPKVGLENGEIIGAEALVRWDSPLHGTVSPDKFVALFERNGFIMQLDRYIFERVCRFYRDEVLDKGLEPLVLSVNVSRLGLSKQDFISTYAAIRRGYGIPAGCMELEFTESLIFDNCTRFQNAVSMCKIMGFCSSLDDFGSGYSSLNLLRSLRVETLKLDRQLFQYGDEAERGRMLVRDIIAMAKDLGMNTVAEGIETEEQVEELRSLGCDAVQGYVYGKPMAPEAFLEFVQNWRKSS